MAGLADLVPEIAAYRQSHQFGQQQETAQLQQAHTLMGILSAVQQQQQRGAALQREQEYRGALSRAQTPEEQYAVALRYGEPAAVISSGDRQASIRATKESTLARLQQAAQQFNQTHEARLRGLTRQEDRDAEIERHNGVMEQLQGQAQRMTGERLFYDTGIRTPLAGPAGAPPHGGMAFNFGSGMQGTVPDEAAGAALWQKLGLPSAGQVDQPYRPAQGAPAPMTPQPVAPMAPQPEAAAPMAAAAAPNNMDARDLTLQRMAAAGPGGAMDMGIGGIGQSMGLGGGYTSPQQAPQKPPEYASWPQRLRNEYDSRTAAAAATSATKAASRESIAGSGVPTKETATFVARQYLNGNDQAISGYARSVPAKLVIMDAIRAEAEKQGLSPEAVNARIAEFQGTKAASRTIGIRSAGIAMAAEEAQQAIQIVKDTSANFPRGNFVPWNYALRAYDTQTGQPEVVQFGAAINALVNTYARALSPSGIPTVSDKEHARQLLSTIQSPAQVDGVLNIINRELEIAKRAPRAVREQIRSDVTGESGHGGGWSIRPR